MHKKNLILVDLMYKKIHNSVVNVRSQQMAKKKKIIIFLLNPDLHWISSYSPLLTNPAKLHRIVTNIEENAINHIF